MRALLTGGSGFLGSHIARRLARAGARLVLTHAPGDPTDHIAAIDAERRPADLLDARALAALVRGVEVVFHVAAMVSFDPRRRARQWRVNVEGTRALLRAAAAAGVRRFVYTSTVNVLGRPRPGTRGDEMTPFDWRRFGLGYMNSKRAAQDAVQAAAGALEVVSVLPGTMFGAGDVFLNAAGYVHHIATGPGLFAPPGGTSVVHVDDVAAGHLLAAERGRPGALYVMAGDAVSYRELFAWIAADLGRRPPPLVLPAWLMRGAGLLADAATGGSFEGLAVAASSALYYRSDRARRELGWSWRPAREAVAESVAWYREAVGSRASR